MNIPNFIFIILILFQLKLSAQFSVENFLNEPLGKTTNIIKDELSGEKIEENRSGDFYRITYFDWLAPISIKVNLLFNNDNKEISKAIMNAKESEADAKKLFDILDKELLKKYGNYISEHSLFGITRYSWFGAGGSMVTLTCESKKTRLQVMVFK